MDNFFSKKGITLSRNPNTHPTLPRETLLRTSEPLPPTLQSFTTTHPKQSKIMAQSQSDHKNMNFIDATIYQKPQQKSYSLENSQKGSLYSFMGVQPPPPKHSQWKYIPSFNLKHKNESNDHNSLSIEIGQEMNELLGRINGTANLDEARPMTDRTGKVEGRQLREGEVKVQNKLTAYLRSRRQQNQERVVKRIPSIELTSTLPKSSGDLPYQQGSYQRQLSSRDVRSKQTQELINGLKQQKQQLLHQLKERDQRIDGFHEERSRLLEELNNKNEQLWQIQNKFGQLEKQERTNRFNLQQEIKILQGSKNRLSVQVQAAKHSLQAERGRAQIAKEQMNKLMFFEQDLIHAKDHQKLKKQLQFALTQNAKLFKQHQLYILEVGESRRELSNRLQQLQSQLQNLRGEISGYRQRLQQLNIGQDKMGLIKLQNELNFQRKKNEQQLMLVLEREKELQQTKLQVQDLKDNIKEIQSNYNTIDGINLWQIKESIALYETRVEDLGRALEVKQGEIDNQKKEIEKLTAQLRDTREDKLITALKQKNNQNNLKNQVETLQRSLQSEIDISSKKVSNLQTTIARKTRQIAEKDKFIKQFLIGRTTSIGRDSAQQIVNHLQNYFHPQPQAPAQ